MSELKEMVDFMEEARDDPRIGPLHISLFTALVYSWIAQGADGPVSFVAREIMSLSKICGGTTFHRCIRQLRQYGYIIYEPSFNAAAKSKVFFPVDVEDRKVFVKNG